MGLLRGTLPSNRSVYPLMTVNKIVEIVANPSRQLTESLQFLRLRLLPFQKSLLGHVDDQGKGAGVLPCFVEQGKRAWREYEYPAPPARKLRSNCMATLAGSRRDSPPRLTARVVQKGRTDSCPAFSSSLQPQHLRQFGIGESGAVIGIDNPDPFGSVLHNLPVFLLLLARRSSSSCFLFRDVDGGSNPFVNRAVVLNHCGAPAARTDRLHRAGAAVLVL